MTKATQRKIVDYILLTAMIIYGLGMVAIGVLFYGYGSDGGWEFINLIAGGVFLICLAFFFPLRSGKRFLVTTAILYIFVVVFGYQSSDIPNIFPVWVVGGSLLYVVRNKLIGF